MVAVFFMILHPFSIPIVNTDLPRHKEIMQELCQGNMEMNSIIAERNILAAPTKIIPRAAERTFILGEAVVIFSDKLK